MWSFQKISDAMYVYNIYSCVVVQYVTHVDVNQNNNNFNILEDVFSGDFVFVMPYYAFVTVNVLQHCRMAVR